MEENMEENKDDLLSNLHRVIREADMHRDIVNSTHKQLLEKFMQYLKRELSPDLLKSFTKEARQILKFYSKI